MREYIFCGKRVDTEEWIEGYLGYNKVRKQYYIMDDVDSFPIPVHKESVGQYTGMKDVADKRIFEGDIMETAVSGITYHRGVVEFADGAFGLRCTDGSAYFLCFVAENYAIIGNVFENKDLLEG